MMNMEIVSGEGKRNSAKKKIDRANVDHEDDARANARKNIIRITKTSIALFSHQLWSGEKPWECVWTE